uniref:Uncharacterized protein n=1 Tax=Anopheles merus TaxID=30066 RepID=A0A182UZ75_ANOME
MKGGSVRKTVTDVINSFFNVLLIVTLGRPRFPLIDSTIRDASPAAGGRDESESTSGRVNFRVVAFANGILVLEWRFGFGVRCSTSDISVLLLRRSCPVCGEP